MRFFLLVFCLCFSTITFSQTGNNNNNNNNVDLDDLEVPDNPAFILLDKAPQTIQRPNSSRALGVSLLHDIVSEGTLNNMAIEVTPFWMTKHPNITALKFYGIDKDLKQYPFSKLKLASVSMAYIKDKDSIINASFGVRATVFELKRESDVKDYYASYSKIESNIFSGLDCIDNYGNTNPEPEEEDYTSRNLYAIALQAYRVARTAYVQQCEKGKGVDRDTYSTNMQEIINRKPAIAVDLAIAYNHRFIDNAFNSNGFGRFGVWSTTAVSLFLDKDQTSHNYVNIYGFLRYLHEKNNIVTGASIDPFNAYDVGVKAEVEFQKLSVGYEYINRSGDLEGYRSAGTIRYQVLDDIFITGSFGNNFQKQDDVISLFGIQWGFNNLLQSIGVPSPTN